MRKQLICLILALTLLCSTVAHGLTYFPTGHAVGEAYRTVNGENCISVDNAEALSDGSVQINPGGSATFGFHTPYGLRGVKLVYDENAAGTALTIATAENQYDITLPEEGGEYSFLFHEILGKEKQDYQYPSTALVGYPREYVEHRGEHTVTVSSERGILLKEMVFEKEHVVVKKTPARLPAVTDETSATYSTVMLDENAPIIVANGGKRFVDYNDPSMRPYKYNDRLYLPINTLAKALEYYHEDYPEKGYALMRSDTHDVVLLDGQCWLVEGVAEKRAIDDEVIIYRDGKTLAAVRYFAELIGDTVGYQDGLVVIDNKYTVEDILTPGKLNNFAKNIFKSFKTGSKEGRTYYVAQNHPAASDDGTGSLVAPLKTISRAAELAEPGDTVIVKEGIYRETLRPQNSGTESAPITFMAAEGENVVISAADVVDGWAHYDGNVWTAPMSWDLGVTRNQVFINDEMLNEARYPNGPEMLYDTEKLDNAWAVKGDLWRPAGEENTSIVRSSTLLWQKEPDYWKGGYYVGHYGIDYAVMTANIVGSKEGELTLGSERTDMWYTDESYFAFGYIVGHMNCLDAPGEWIRQNDTLYMIFPEGATPNETQVEAKARQLVIDLKDRSHVYVKGFKTIGGGARANEGQMNMLNGLDMKYISHYIHQSASYKGNIEFPFDPKDTNAAPERGESGIFLSGSDNHIVNCNIDHTAGAGIFISGLYSYIENNIIHDCYNSNYVSGIQIMNRGYEDVTKPIGGAAIFNNTVYKTGRSCLNISTQKGVGNQLYLPQEVAYNDFHDAMMSTLDTGITYEYDVEQSIDGYYSRLHHNYVYMLTAGRDKNPFTFGIYHDGGSHGFDTYKNQIFYVDKAAPFGHVLFVQPAAAAPAYMRVWDNSENLISDSVAGLDKQYFTEEKAYYAGAMRDTETMEPVEYTRNYDRFVNGQFTMEHTVAKTYKKNPANLSEGVIYDEESGYAAFTGNDQYVHFEDVSFPEGTNAMTLMFRGDSHYSHDTIEVIIGENIESGKIFNGMVDLDGYDLDSPERNVVELGEITGVYDVWVKVKEYKSAELGGISVYCDELYLKNDTLDQTQENFTAYRWAGEFSERVKFSGTGTGPNVLNLADYPGRNLMNETWGGWYVKYDDVAISEESDKFVMAAGSGGHYAHQPFEIYLEDKNSTGPSDKYITRYLEDSDEWSDRAPQIVNLDTAIKPGTYDVYIKLCDDEGYGKSSTVVYFGFLATGELPEQMLKETSIVYGGNFDNDLSIQNPDFPFKATYMNPPNYKNKGLTYTLPGTCAVYKNINLIGDCNAFEINYASEGGVDGQPVEIWIGDPNNGGWKAAEFITESKGGITVFEEVTVPCEKIIPAGMYDIYIKFGGDQNSRKTCNIEKFSFTYKK